MMHCGTVLGHDGGGGGGGADIEVEVALAWQAVQIVDVEVTVTLDTVVLTDVIVLPADVRVAVTGQMVVVSYVTTVVITSVGRGALDVVIEVMVVIGDMVVIEDMPVPVGIVWVVAIEVSDEALPVTAATEDGTVGIVVAVAAVVSVAVTGQMVVETAMVEVTVIVDSAGQLVTVGAQLVMVTSLVV